MYGMERRAREAAVARPDGPAPIMIATGSGSGMPRPVVVRRSE